MYRFNICRKRQKETNGHIHTRIHTTEIENLNHLKN